MAWGAYTKKPGLERLQNAIPLYVLYNKSLLIDEVVWNLSASMSRTKHSKFLSTYTASKIELVSASTVVETLLDSAIEMDEYCNNYTHQRSMPFTAGWIEYSSFLFTTGCTRASLAPVDTKSCKTGWRELHEMIEERGIIPVLLRKIWSSISSVWGVERPQAHNASVKAGWRRERSDQDFRSFSELHRRTGCDMSWLREFSDISGATHVSMTRKSPSSLMHVESTRKTSWTDSILLSLRA